MNICYIPFGTRCSSAFIIRDNFKQRKEALPFDWLDMPISALKQFVNLEESDVDSFVDSYFESVGTIGYKYEETDLLAYNRHLDGTWFAHDIELIDNSYRLKEGTKEKFKRRLLRLLKIINDPNNFLFFLTVIYKTEMYSAPDFDKVRQFLNKKVLDRSVFVTVNLDHIGFYPRNQFNFHIPQLETFDDGLKGWEALIYDTISSDLKLNTYIKEITNR